MKRSTTLKNCIRCCRDVDSTVVAAVVLLAACTASATAQEAVGPEILVADFESEGYGDWKVEGTAFGKGPARGALPGQMAVEGFSGSGLVNSFFEGDASVGTLESPQFVIQRSYITFLIGGGMNPEQLALQLLIDGKVVRQATGPNDRSGGSEALVRESWEVNEYKGSKATIRILDQATGGWGHINVDHIVQTDKKPPGLIRDAKRQFVVNARYLNIPIKNGAAKRMVTLIVDGQDVVRNEIELADGTADWWAPMDVSAWTGQTITLNVDKLPEESVALAAIEQSDTLKDADNLYAEPLRGQFHFSPRRGWNNDPNGMVYYNDEYHLFFQHNPYGWGWGNMHWGHAVSKDMVHWQELGDKLLPDSMGTMFSGGAVVDWKNTSGFGKDGKPPLVLFYTAAGSSFVQGIAWSTDGRTFTKYAGNPVLQQITGGNRDPKVIWHEPSGKWVMVLYVEVNGVHTIHFFTSPNLRDWTFTSKTDGFFECPEFFELPVDGNSAQTKWVLLAASSEYQIGTFDGTKFTPESPKVPGHRGRGFYAAQTFSDVPDGRRLMMGWFQTETRGMPFNQSMSIPLELRLGSTENGPRLTFAPAGELESLRTKSHSINTRSLKQGDPNPLDSVRAELIELRAEFEPGTANEIVFLVRGATIVYDAQKQELVVNGHRAAAPLSNGRQGLTIFCDRNGLEVFASGGLCYVPMPFIPKADDLSVGIAVPEGEIRNFSAAVHELRSAWTSR